MAISYLPFFPSGGCGALQRQSVRGVPDGGAAGPGGGVRQPPQPDSAGPW